MVRKAAAHGGAFLGGPGAEAFAGFHAKLAALDAFGKQTGWRARVIQLGSNNIVDIACQFEADEIGILHGPQHRKSGSETVLYDGVDGFGIADAVFDKAEGFAPERVLQAVTNEAGDVAMYFDGPLTDLEEQSECLFKDFLVGVFGAHDLNERDEIGRVPPVCTQEARAGSR